MSKKITDLTLLATADANDLLVIEDVSASTTKKTTIAGISAGLPVAGNKIVRDNNGSVTVESTARILTGWGIISNAAATSISEAVVFDEAFVNVPIILVNVAGDASTATADALGNGGNSISGGMSAKHYSDSTTGFTLRIFKDDGTNFNTSGKTYYTWMAVGV